MRFAPLIATLLAAALVVGVASAQSATDKAAAEALFQKGVELLDQGKPAEACKKLEASQRLDSGVGTLLYLGECYERLGRVASAWATFREAQSIAQARGEMDRAKVAQERAGALEPRLPKLWIRVEGDRPEGFTVTRNGKRVPKESWGLALPVDPVQQVIEATAPGKRPWKETIVVPAEKVEVEVDIPRLADLPEEAETATSAPAPAPPPPLEPTTQPAVLEQDTGTTSRPGKGQRTAGIVVGATGLAGIVAGSVLGVVARDRNDESKDFCRRDDQALCTQHGVNLRNDAKTAATISTIGFAVGGAALAAGIVLYLTAPKNDESAAANARRLRLSTVVAPTGGRLTVGGDW